MEPDQMNPQQPAVDPKPAVDPNAPVSPAPEGEEKKEEVMEEPAA